MKAGAAGGSTGAAVAGATKFMPSVSPVKSVGDTGGGFEHGFLLGVGRHRGALCCNGFKLGAVGFLRRQHAGGSDGLEDKIARTQRGVGVAIETPCFRRLRQRHQQCGLGIGKLARLLAEVPERGGAHAFDAPAEGGEGEIEPEDLLLAELPLELEGADDLAQLHRWRTLVLIVEQPRDLHGQRGAATDDALLQDEIAGGAGDAEGVYPEVRVEASILEGEQHGEVARIDVLGGQDDRGEVRLLRRTVLGGSGKKVSNALQRRRPQLRHGDLQPDLHDERER